MIHDKSSPRMVDARMHLNAALDLIGSMRDEAVREKHAQGRDLSIAITHIEDSFFRLNRAAHTR